MGQTESIDPAISAIADISSVPVILDVVCRTTGMGFAAVARVTEDRWIACSLLDHIAFGLQPGDELPVKTTLCDRVRDNREPIVIDDAAVDPVYCGHQTPALYGFRSYISMPIIRADGAMFGTLCAIDPQPRRIDTPEMRGMFRAFADLIAGHLTDREQVKVLTKALAEERRDAQLREEFVAVLGHDLRNPLAAVDAGIRVLMRQTLADKQVSVLDLMHGSVRRMAGLIDNILDFARARLGGGLQLHLQEDTALQPMLEQVVAEIGAAWPARNLDSNLSVDAPVVCDRVKIGQLLSNLLANAMTHGAAGAPVSVAAATRDGGFALSVANGGPPIPQAAMDRLFQPFYRSSVLPTQQGLGLGLYIAAMIAEAHGGTLTVASSPVETRFTFRMPAQGEGVLAAH